MRVLVFGRRVVTSAAVIAIMATTGCKSLNERYIALEVWKYEKCFGHLPPGFTPPGAAPAMVAAPPRVCGQQQPCCDSAPAAAAQGMWTSVNSLRAITLAGFVSRVAFASRFAAGSAGGASRLLPAVQGWAGS